MLILLALAACAPVDPILPADEVVSAGLEAMRLHEIAVGGGYAWGTATLVMETVEEELIIVPMKLQGPIAGAVVNFDLGVDLQDQDFVFGGARTANLIEGRYNGIDASLGAGVGVEATYLVNNDKVKMSNVSITTGAAGVSIAWQHLKLTVDR